MITRLFKINPVSKNVDGWDNCPGVSKLPADKIVVRTSTKKILLSSAAPFYPLFILSKCSLRTIRSNIFGFSNGIKYISFKSNVSLRWHNMCI